MFKLDNKVIIVTGGSGLLGKEIINCLKILGATTINADINIKSNLKEGSLCVDVTSEKSVLDAVKSVSAFYGKIDGLVNNAYPRTSDWGTRFEDLTYESWRKNIDMQLNTVFLFIQKIMPELLKTKGSIVNIGSIYGVVGNDFTIYRNTEVSTAAQYSAIKGGVISLTRYLASYYGKKGVRVNCVSPGGIFDNQNGNFIVNYESKVPLGRMGKPDDIAPVVSFLLSNASKYITGQNILVDGGWTAV
jgi:NAD(P)-dependent dehydrogenase (short-subunit alcohol dehydrogenase family)